MAPPDSARYTVFASNDGAARLSDLWIIYTHTCRAQRADLTFDYLRGQYRVQMWMGNAIRQSEYFAARADAECAAIAWMDYRDGPPEPVRFTDGTLVSDFWKAQRRQ